MKFAHVPTALLFTALLLNAGCATDGAASAPTDPAHEVDMEEMTARWMEYSTPGEPHTALARAAGRWNVEGAGYWDPSGEPTPMVATAETEVLLGGRIVKETFHSDFMGQPFEGLLLQGYDNRKREYWSLWFDNMSTWGSFSTGNYNAAGELVLEGLMHDAVTPEGRPTRTVVRETDEDHANMKMYDLGPDGSAALTMELNYTRAE